MNNKKKIIFILVIFIIIFIIIIPKNEMAFDISGLGDLNNYDGDGGTSTRFDLMINKTVYIIQIVGSIVSVVALIVMGIKYMFSGIEERAEYKKTMMPYVIGAFMVFGISNVTGLLYYLAQNLFS